MNASQAFPLFGVYKLIELVDYKGRLKYQEKNLHNGINLVGKQTLLTSFFFNTSPPASFYFGIVDSSGFVAFNDLTDSMSSHSQWNEFSTYSNGTRPAWGTAAATVSGSTASITNATVATFNITGSGSLHGIFATTNNTISGVTGLLWSTAAFTSNVAVSNGDALKITYTVNA